jgi:hypothetical protein
MAIPDYESLMLPLREIKADFKIGNSKSWNSKMRGGKRAGAGRPRGPIASIIAAEETRGGKRAGAGRPRGSITKRRRETAAEAATAVGMTPLEYMLRVMVDEKAEPHRRDAMASAAAPYLHPRLAAVQVSGHIGTDDRRDEGSDRDWLAQQLDRCAPRTIAPPADPKPNAGTVR